MKDIVVVGGMGSGKTTLCRTLKDLEPDLNWYHMGHLVVKVPLALKEQGFNFDQVAGASEYMSLVKHNSTLSPLQNYTREELDTMMEYVHDRFGNDISARLAIQNRDSSRMNLVDNVPKEAGVKYLRDSGFYVVAMNCPENVQIDRAMKRGKSVDPTTVEQMQSQVCDTNRRFQISRSRAYAHRVILSDNVSLDDYVGIAKEILEVCR